MHRFEIWAPRAKKMAVQVNGVTVPMEGPHDDGWWRRDVDNAVPGASMSGYRRRGTRLMAGLPKREARRTLASGLRGGDR